LLLSVVLTYSKKNLFFLIRLIFFAAKSFRPKNKVTATILLSKSTLKIVVVVGANTIMTARHHYITQIKRDKREKVVGRREEVRELASEDM